MPAQFFSLLRSNGALISVQQCRVRSTDIFKKGKNIMDSLNPTQCSIGPQKRKKIVQAYATCQTSFESPVNILVIIYKSHAGKNPTFTTKKMLSHFGESFSNTKIAPW